MCNIVIKYRLSDVVNLTCLQTQKKAFDVKVNIIMVFITHFNTLA